MSGISVRLAERSDIEAMHRIRLRVRENRLASLGLVTEASYKPFVDAGTCWTARVSTQLLGFAALDRAAEEVWALFVAPEWERHGIGSSLHDHLVAWARSSGMQRLVLRTDSRSTAASFYVRRGWEPTHIDERGEAGFQLWL